jgi:hypothetical protein
MRKQHKRKKKRKILKNKPKKKTHQKKSFVVVRCNEIVAMKRKLNLIVNLFVPMVH